MDSEVIYQQVQDHYGSMATNQNSGYSDAVAKAFGYSAEELQSIPPDANLGLSCGNPLAIASLREGETVIDLGSGAGFDCFLAAKKVGKSGRVIGVDMNQNMLSRAHKNKANSAEYDMVSFVEGKITSIPLEDGVADCIISNCVINLVPEAEKASVFSEMGRLLKPGGRLAISDMLTRKEMPEQLRTSVALYVGCVAGASSQQNYSRWLEDAGFAEIVMKDDQSDLNVYVTMADGSNGSGTAAAPCCGPPKETKSEKPSSSGCCGPSAAPAKSQANGNGALNMEDVDVNEWLGSFKIFAVKK